MIKNIAPAGKSKRLIRKAFQIFIKTAGILAGYFWIGQKGIMHNRILFETFQGTYTCSCKYIAEEIIRSGADCELIFIVNKDVYKNREACGIPKVVRLVQRDSFENYVILASSKIWVDNALNCIWKGMPKKKEQIYINTWHGSLGIKRLDGDKKWKRAAALGNKRIDYFVTNSAFEESVFRESFWPDVKRLKFGHPRNDIFFDPEKIKKCREKVCKYYRIDSTEKIVLYAPTFRDNKTDVSALQLNYEAVREALRSKFGGEWTVLMKRHFHNAGRKQETGSGTGARADGTVVNADGYMDMQELLAAADAGITDYSSWIFDYLLLKRPAFIYAEDITDYSDSRGFYYPLSETPFPVADSNDALLKNIRQFDKAVFVRACDRFLKEKGCYEMGNAGERLAEFMEEYIRK